MEPQMIGGGRWGIHQIDPRTGKVTGGTIGCGYKRRIDAEVECVRRACRSWLGFTPSDWMPFSRFSR